MGWPLSHPDPKPWWPAHMLGRRCCSREQRALSSGARGPRWGPGYRSTPSRPLTSRQAAGHLTRRPWASRCHPCHSYSKEPAPGHVGGAAGSVGAEAAHSREAPVTSSGGWSAWSSFSTWFTKRNIKIHVATWLLSPGSVNRTVNLQTVLEGSPALGSLLKFSILAISGQNNKITFFFLA